MKQSLICARLVRKTAFCPSEITTIFTEIWFNYISIPYTSSLISSLEFNFKAKKLDLRGWFNKVKKKSEMDPVCKFSCKAWFADNIKKELKWTCFHISMLLCYRNFKNFNINFFILKNLFFIIHFEFWN